jgi:transporter family protein
MDLTTFLIVIVTFISWGVGTFISKIAANKIGAQSVFWHLLGYAPAVTIYSIIVFKLRNLVGADRIGIGLAILAGVVGSFGAIGFYFLLKRAEASTITPLTALYPALTAVLAFIFLHESVNLTKLLGIALSLIAIYLLSK